MLFALSKCCLKLKNLYSNNCLLFMISILKCLGEKVTDVLRYFKRQRKKKIKMVALMERSADE